MASWILTLMPYDSYRRSAECLSDTDVSLAYLACGLALASLVAPEDLGLIPTETALMWAGYESDLLLYMGFLAQRLGVDVFQASVTPLMPMFRSTPTPPWLGWQALHISHRQWLLVGNPDHYGPKWPEMLKGMNEQGFGEIIDPVLEPGVWPNGVAPTIDTQPALADGVTREDVWRVLHGG